MGIFSGIGRGLRLVADSFDPSAPRDMTDPRYWADYGGRATLAGVDVNERRVSQLGAVQSVRFGLSGAMSSIPVMLFKQIGANKVAQPNHPLAQLLRRPNDRNTAAEFFGEIAWHLSFYRNAYCAIHPGLPGSENYALGSLEILHPRRLAKIERRLDGHIWYTFNPPATTVQGATLPSVDYRDDTIWHLRGNPLTEDGMLGEPIWRTAREVFARALAVHDYGDIWFANNGQSGGTLEHPGQFKDKEDRNTFLENWREAGVGRNRHKDRLLTHGVKYTPIKVTNSEAQLLETEKAADTDIFGLWSYPPHRAARMDTATNNNIEQQSLDFVLYGLAPIGAGIEQGGIRDLLLDEDPSLYSICFNFEPLLRGSMRDQSAALLIARQGEWMSANDVLRYLGRNPRTDAAGNEYKNPMTQGAKGAVETGNDDNDPSTKQ